MSKTTTEYWDPLAPENDGRWEVIEGTEGLLEQLTLALDETTGDYTRLTRFKSGADTRAFGVKGHGYLEEIFVVKGRLYDAAFDHWLTPGEYASRPLGECHGPFQTDEECIVLEVSYPSQAQEEP